MDRKERRDQATYCQSLTNKKTENTADREKELEEKEDSEKGKQKEREEEKKRKKTEGERCRKNEDEDEEVLIREGQVTGGSLVRKSSF